MTSELRSPLANMTQEESRRFILNFDGLRYSVRIVRVISPRLMRALDEAVQFKSEGKSTEDSICSALSDAWTIVDMTHRIREILQQFPRLPKKRPEVQVFLRATAQVELLRNHVQHFRNEIPNYPKESTPLWGALSWVLDSEPRRCYSVLTGNPLVGLGAPTISFDLLSDKFVSNAALYSGLHTVNLVDLVKACETVFEWILEWLPECGVGVQKGDTPIFSIALPALRPI